MRSVLLVAGLSLLAAVLVPMSGEYGTLLATEILIWMLFAVSFDLVLGYAGMLSIAHSLFFGLGAYTVVLLSRNFDVGLISALVSAVLVAAAAGTVVGAVAVRVISHSFIVVTIIFSQVGYLVAMSWRSVTGGDDGLNVATLSLNLLGWNFNLGDSRVGFLFCLVVVAACFLLLRRIVNSPLGDAFVAIRENPDRAALLGYNVALIRLAAFAIGAVFSGVAGSLYASVFRYANADLFKWVVSGDAIIWTVIGGMGTLFGPAIGAAVLIVVKDHMGSVSPELYLIFVGLLIIVASIFAPRGIVGWLKPAMAAWKNGPSRASKFWRLQRSPEAGRD